MGKEIEKIALSRGHEVVSIIDINNREDFASEAFRSADVAIEFTAPSVAYGNCLEAFKNGVKVVSGSTGWMGEHGEEMRRLCQEEGKTLFWSSNFSLGVAIFAAVNKYLAKIMNQFPNYDVSMVETHHVHKLDDKEGVGSHIKLDTDAIEVSLKGFVEPLHFFRVGIGGVRVELFQHADNGGFHQFVFVYLIYIEIGDGELGQLQFARRRIEQLVLGRQGSPCRTSCQ